MSRRVSGSVGLRPCRAQKLNPGPKPPIDRPDAAYREPVAERASPFPAPAAAYTHVYHQQFSFWQFDVAPD